MIVDLMLTLQRGASFTRAAQMMADDLATRAPLGGVTPDDILRVERLLRDAADELTRARWTLVESGRESAPKITGLRPVRRRGKKGGAK